MKIIELYEQYYKRYNDLDLNIEHQNIFSLEINYLKEVNRLLKDYKKQADDSELFEEQQKKMNEITSKFEEEDAKKYNSNKF